MFLKYEFPNVHQQYTWQDIKFCQNLISCQVYCWCTLGNSYFKNIQNKILDAPKIVFTEIQALTSLFSGTNELRALQQNCNFAHLQNLLLVMLGDFAHLQNLLLVMLGEEDKTVRAKALIVIQKIRNAEEGNQGEQDRV